MSICRWLCSISLWVKHICYVARLSEQFGIFNQGSNFGCKQLKKKQGICLICCLVNYNIGPIKSWKRTKKSFHTAEDTVGFKSNYYIVSWIFIYANLVCILLYTVDQSGISFSSTCLVKLYGHLLLTCHVHKQCSLFYWSLNVCVPSSHTILHQGLSTPGQ